MDRLVMDYNEAALNQVELLSRSSSNSELGVEGQEIHQALSAAKHLAVSKADSHCLQKFLQFRLAESIGLPDVLQKLLKDTERDLFPRVRFAQLPAFLLQFRTDLLVISKSKIFKTVDQAIEVFRSLNHGCLGTYGYWHG